MFSPLFAAEASLDLPLVGMRRKLKALRGRSPQPAEGLATNARDPGSAVEGIGANSEDSSLYDITKGCHTGRERTHKQQKVQVELGASKLSSVAAR